MATPKSYMLCLDRNKALWKRAGEQLFVASCMVEFDGMLVLGCGDSGGTKPNLLFFDNATYTEQGEISSNAATTHVIRSEYLTPMYGIEDNSRKFLTRWEMVYEDKVTYQATGVSIYYRVDYEDWTLLKSLTLSKDGKVKFTEGDKELQESGVFWQFKIVGDDDFKVISFTPWLRSDPIVQK